MEQLRTRHDFFYFQIVTRYYLNYIKMLKKFTSSDNLNNMDISKESLSKYEGQKFTKEELEKIIKETGINDVMHNLFQLRTFGTMSVVFSALCLESLINDYCVFKKSANFLNSYVDKLHTVSKWRVFPELFTGKPFPTDGKAFELLTELYSFRNSLVHPKSKNIERFDDISDEQNPLIQDTVKNIKKFDRSFITIKEATSELYKIDNDFYYLENYEWLWKGDAKKIQSISAIESFYQSIISETNYRQK